MSIQKIDASNIVLANAHIKELKKVIEKSNQWRECAQELAERLRLRGVFTGLFSAEASALAEFDRLKEDSK
jgi:hypothetical protein